MTGEPHNPGAQSALDPFADLMFDGRHRDLARQLFSWSIDVSDAPDIQSQAKRAFLASAFGSACAPRSASHSEIFISTKFLMFFFLIDDAPNSIMEIETELISYHRSLISELRGLGRDTRDFEEALLKILLTMQEEKLSNPYQWSMEKLLSVRKIVIGISAFSECWRTIKGLSFSKDLKETLQNSNILDITCETACLVNDIASFHRDARDLRDDPERADPNLALMQQMKAPQDEQPQDEQPQDEQPQDEQPQDEQSAVTNTIKWYNEKIREFHKEEQELLNGKYRNDPALVGYLEILRCAIIGDLTISQHLAPIRYADSQEALSRLLRLDSLD